VILALDSTLGACSVALGDRDYGILASEHETRARGHAEAIVPMIETVLKKTGRRRSEISGIACTTGPGSFTGVRVGIAAAKGLALGLRVPAAGIPTLEALAAALLYDDKAPLTKATSAIAVIDGPREGFIAQTFSIDIAAGLVSPITEIEGCSEDQTPSMDFEAIEFVVGPAASRLARLAELHGIRATDRQPDARSVCRYVLGATKDRWQRNLSPIYFRPPHAEPSKPPPWM
jgi:tRNA threonylcarbamoyl adenosine modification protein YeaZ